MRLTTEQRNSLIDAYQAGAKTIQLASKYGISRTSVYGLLSRRGLLKSPSASQRKYPLRENVFDEVTTEEAAYWLGFLAADGYVYRNALSLRIGQNDLTHLVKFRDWIQPQKPKQPIHSTDGSVQVGVEVKSKHLIDSLSVLGVGAAKTYKFVQRPLIQDDLVRHFYRGYVDGDGSIGYIGSKYRFELLGTEPFLVQFEAWLHNQLAFSSTKVSLRHGMWRIQRSGRIVVSRIVSLLYDNASVYLERKNNAAINILRLGRSQRPEFAQSVEAIRL